MNPLFFTRPILTALFVVVFSLPSAAQAEAWHIATFETSKTQPVACPNCREGWGEAIQHALPQKDLGPKILRGHIIKVDLSHQRLAVMVTRRVTDGPCANHVGPVAYTDPPIEAPLPVLLRTVPQWMEESGAALALSGANFHFDANQGVRAELPCGEVIGVNLHDGHLDWPQPGAPELLRENIDANPQWPADTLLINHDRTARVLRVQDYADLNQAAFAIAGSALFTETGGENNGTGTKPDKNLARLGIGVLPGRQHLIIILLEGRSTTVDGFVVGSRLNRLRRLMHEFGAIDAINLDGSGSAQVVGPGGFATTPSDPEGARPVANHLGFRLADKPVTWTSYGQRQGNNQGN